MTRANISPQNCQPIIIDPNAIAVATAIAKLNCRSMLDANADRVAHFKQRLRARGQSASDIVIVLIDPDDEHGRIIADGLMPGYNWKAIRDRGEVPVARGLAMRDGIVEVVAEFDDDAAAKLQAKPEALFVVVVANGVAEAYEV